MTPTVERLHRARGYAWSSLRPVFDHAIGLAYEAERQHGSPVYPVLVIMLADSVGHRVEGQLR